MCSPQTVFQVSNQSPFTWRHGKPCQCFVCEFKIYKSWNWSFCPPCENGCFEQLFFRFFIFSITAFEQLFVLFTSPSVMQKSTFFSTLLKQLSKLFYFLRNCFVFPNELLFTYFQNTRCSRDSLDYLTTMKQIKILRFQTYLSYHLW